MKFIVLAFHQTPLPRPPHHRRHFQTRLCVEPPSTYEALHADAITATKAALSSNRKFLEVQFPAVSNMATAALNELLDANRNHARKIIAAFTPNYPAANLHLVFPDVAEASLARKAFGETPFHINAIPKSPPAYTSEQEGLIMVVQPGFNVSEWIDMQNLAGGPPIVTINADLDKVRSGYYPRLFYPGLHRAKENFLSKFEETYYVKMLSNGGTLLRVFPANWRLFYTDLKGGRELLWSGEDRPVFKDVERILAVRRVKDLQAR